MKRRKHFRIRHIILGLLAVFVFVMLIFMHFGGFSTGENTNPE